MACGVAATENKAAKGNGVCSNKTLLTGTGDGLESAWLLSFAWLEVDRTPSCPGKCGSVD